jgi:acyl-CoA synthetase (NDP forming)
MNEISKAVKHPDLGRLLAARSIAFVGASPRTSAIRGMTESLKRHGYSGRIFMINPNYPDVLGYRCYPSLHALPSPPDLAIITIKASAVGKVIDDAIAVGTKAALVYSTGFADAGPSGFAELERLKRTVCGKDILICGPGSFGFVNLRDGVTPFSAGPEGAIPAGNVGMVAQSGGFSNIMTMAAAERGFGYSFLVASGGEMMLNAADYLGYLVEDAGTRLLVAILEEIRDVPRFSAVLSRAAELGKPVIVLPLGRSTAGQRATSAHSGALASCSDIQDAYLAQAGAIVVRTLDDLIETVVLLSAWEGAVPSSVHPLFVTVSGGDCALILDLAEDIGLAVPELGADTRQRLAALLPESTMLLNPVDLGTRPFTERELVAKSYEIAAADPAVDLIMTRLFVNPDDVRRAALGAVASGKRHVMFTRAALALEPLLAAACRDNRVPLLQGVDRSLAAVKRVVGYGAWRQEHHADVVPIPDLVDLDLSVERFQQPLSETAALDVLRAGGVSAVPYRIALTGAAAVAAAEEIGFPVAIKVLSADIEHKSDIGGVRLNLASSADVIAAEREIRTNVARYRPDARIEGLVVQPMRRPRLELIFGMIPDPRFGTAVLAGFGGVLAETLGRTVTRLAPLTLSGARAAIAELLAPAGGAPVQWRGLDIEAAMAEFAKFSTLAAALGPYVEAIDVNPVGVFDTGRGAEALDCLILPRGPRVSAAHA